MRHIATRCSRLARRMRGAAAAAALAGLLAACGGGGGSDGGASANSSVPDSALASVRAWTDYTAWLAGEMQSAERATPLLLPAAAAPVSETDAPQQVD